MFERFTNKARHAVVLSQEEARQLNHNYIGTEHLLLGLLGEPESVAGKVLTNVGLTLNGVRAEVEATIGRGKKAPGGHIPFTPRAKKTLELSLREALQLGHNYIGTEHILLGLIRQNEGVAFQMLREHVDLPALRAAIIEAVPAADPGDQEDADEASTVLRWLRNRLTRHGGTVPLRIEQNWSESGKRGTPAVEAALAQAAALAGPLPVGSHHLLLAALADGNSAASSALASLGVDVGELKEKLRTMPVTGTSDELPREAGRRQMAIQVSGEILTLTLTDPVIVAAGQEALRAVNASAAAMAAVTDEEAEQSGAVQSEAVQSEAATASVIRGDHPAAAGLAGVWEELRKTLATLAGSAPPAADAPPADTPPADPPSAAA